MLGRELKDLKEIRGDLPKIFIVHMDNQLETEIAAELKIFSGNLGVKITFASEGMQLII